MADDRDKAIRDYVVLTPLAIHLGIVRPDVQVDNFELKVVMFMKFKLCNPKGRWIEILKIKFSKSHNNLI